MVAEAGTLDHNYVANPSVGKYFYCKRNMPVQDINLLIIYLLINYGLKNFFSVRFNHGVKVLNRQDKRT